MLLVQVEQLQHGGEQLGVRAVLADGAGQPGQCDRLLGVAAAEGAADRLVEVRDGALEQRVERLARPGRRAGGLGVGALEDALELSAGDRPERGWGHSGLDGEPQVQ